MAEECETVGATPEKSLSVRTYSQLKERILACIEAAANIEHAREYALAELREKIEGNTFNLVVVGQFKRGKTCLINALLGASILPVAVVPLTSVGTILTYGKDLKIQVLFNNGSVSEVEFVKLADYVTETGNPRNIKGVREVVIDYPSPYLRDGVRLIDTPGVGSVYEHNTDSAYRYLPKSDAAVFLLSVDQPVSKAEVDFLKDVRQYSDKIFFLLNKIDYLSESEVAESIAFTRQTIKEVTDADVKIFPVSAKLALEGQLEGSEELIDSSNLPEFSKVLNGFLLNEKGRVLLLSVIGNLRRIISQIRLELELEQKSLTTPINELREKLEAFKDKKEEILREKEIFDILLDKELNNLVSTNLDNDIKAFREQFIPQIEQQLEVFHDEHKELPLKELNGALESYVASEVEKAFTTWHAKEEEEISTAFMVICDRFSQKIQLLVDDLHKFSSQLFAIPYEPLRAEMVWTAESNFFFKLRENIVGLEMLASSLTQVAPGLVSSRFKKIKAYVLKLANGLIFTKSKEHMLQAIEMQSGRMRFDFVERIKKSKQSFRRVMLERIDATVDGLSAAIEKGVNRKAEDQKQADERYRVLLDDLHKLNDITAELLCIREAMGNTYYS
ncbi:MAG: dynamin family protein [Syntrophobacteraceae bacterium]